MSNATDLSTCKCCETTIETPSHTNRPGQSALAYRIGTHSTFLRRMVARLATQEIPTGETAGARPLADFTIRSTEDPAIALLDAWATVGDVLTFYQERIANEGYLHTATERRSVLELARAIGYELSPGVAASTYLTFTVDDAESSPDTAMIEAGTQVQSIPAAQGELPQTFETIEEIEARAEWNAMQPRQSELKIPRYGSKEVYLKGVETGLRPGDPLLFIGRERHDDAGSERWDSRRVSTVMVNSKLGYTKVTWKEGLGWARFGRRILPAEKDFTVYTFRQRAALFGYNAPDWRAMPDSVKEEFLEQGKGLADYDDWPRFNLDSDDTIHLDAVYPRIIPRSWVVLSVPDYEEVYDVTEAEEESSEDFTLTAKTARLKLRGENLIKKFGQSRRDTTVFAQSEQLELAEKPLATPVYGTKIVLDRLVEDLDQGQTIVVSGKRVEHVKVAQADDLRLISEDDPQKGKKLKAGNLLETVEPPLPTADGRIQWHLKDQSGFAGFVTTQPDDLVPEPASEDDETISEVAFIENVSSGEKRSTLVLEDPLRNSYDRTTVAICANVVKATHGETVTEEVLGSGDGAHTHQQFTLKKSPLTYVSAATASGAKSTLELRVNRVLWEEVSSL